MRVLHAGRRLYGWLQASADGRGPGQWGSQRGFLDNEHAIWMGDLNYRVTIPDEQVRPQHAVASMRAAMQCDGVPGTVALLHKFYFASCCLPVYMYGPSCSVMVFLAQLPSSDTMLMSISRNSFQHRPGACNDSLCLPGRFVLSPVSVQDNNITAERSLANCIMIPDSTPW